MTPAPGPFHPAYRRGALGVRLAAAAGVMVDGSFALLVAGVTAGAAALLVGAWEFRPGGGAPVPGWQALLVLLAAGLNLPGALRVVARDLLDLGPARRLEGEVTAAALVEVRSRWRRERVVRLTVAGEQVDVPAGRGGVAVPVAYPGDAARVELARGSRRPLAVGVQRNDPRWGPAPG